MYVLTGKNNLDKSVDNIFCSGVFENLKQVFLKMVENNNMIKDDFKYIDYKDNKKEKRIKFINMYETLIKDFQKFTSVNYTYGNYTYNIKMFNEVIRDNEE